MCQQTHSSLSGQAVGKAIDYVDINFLEILFHVNKQDQTLFTDHVCHDSSGIIGSGFESQSVVNSMDSCKMQKAQNTSLRSRFEIITNATF